VCGERRFKASQKAGLKDIPAVIRELTDEQVLEFQIVENLQREDLNPIEEGQGFKMLLEQCKYTQEKLAGKIGKSQGYIAARLALLNLTDDFQKDIISGQLLPGHVKHLMVVADRPKILQAIRKEMGAHQEQLTVRAFESIVNTVFGRQAKTLGKERWGGGAEFNTKECNDCEFKRTIQSVYGAATKKCVNSDCFNKKQRLFRKAAAERVKKKVENGGVVEADQLKNVEYLDNHRCNFNKNSCKRCEKRKVADVKEYGKKTKKEVCTDKECFARKNKEAEQAKEKAKQEAFKKCVEKIKAKAARTKMDRNFWVSILATKIDCQYYVTSEQQAVIEAYGLDPKRLKSRKSRIDYFTGNKSLNLEEIFRFITYWED